MRLKIVICRELEGGYSVAVPALPGCYSEGDSLSEARANALEAAECWLDGAVASDILSDEESAVAAQLHEWQGGAEPIVEELDLG
jgi:predicted RNase H-like HicB family nuclease